MKTRRILALLLALSLLFVLGFTACDVKDNDKDEDKDDGTDVTPPGGDEEGGDEEGEGEDVACTHPNKEVKTFVVDPYVANTVREEISATESVVKFTSVRGGYEGKRTYTLTPPIPHDQAVALRNTLTSNDGWPGMSGFYLAYVCEDCALWINWSQPALYQNVAVTEIKDNTVTISQIMWSGESGGDNDYVYVASDNPAIQDSPLIRKRHNQALTLAADVKYYAFNYNEANQWWEIPAYTLVDSATPYLTTAPGSDRKIFTAVVVMNSTQTEVAAIYFRTGPTEPDFNVPDNDNKIKFRSSEISHNTFGNEKLFPLYPDNNGGIIQVSE